MTTTRQVQMPPVPGRRDQLLEVGFWAPLDPTERIAHLVACWAFGKVPYPEANLCIDRTWSANERTTILAYLSKGERVPDGEFGFSTCRICGVRNGSAEFTDGVYVWPEGFAHYISEHAVKPADVQFIRYVVLGPHLAAVEAAKTKR